MVTAAGLAFIKCQQLNKARVKQLSYGSDKTQGASDCNDAQASQDAVTAAGQASVNWWQLTKSCIQEPTNGLAKSEGQVLCDLQHGPAP